MIISLYVSTLQWCLHWEVHINGDLPHLEYLGPVLIKQKLTAVPPPGSSRKMFDTLYLYVTQQNAAKFVFER